MREDTGTTRDTLTTKTTITTWTANSNNTPVCFVTPQELNGFDASVTTQVQYGQAGLAYQQYFRYAVERAWPAVACLHASGFASCPTQGSTRFIRYAITDGIAGVSNYGMGPITQTFPTIEHKYFPLPTVPFDGNIDGSGNISYVGGRALPIPLPDGGSMINPQMLAPSSLLFAKYTVHEFGHVLGWIHEQDSTYNRDSNGNDLLLPDGAVQWCAHTYTAPPVNVVSPLTSLDPLSIMAWSYCGTANNGNQGLTQSDIAGTRVIYGVCGGGSDGDKFGDLEDNCPYVDNPTQSDSNWDAELTIATRDNGWTGTVVNGQSRPEGHVPLADDPDWYKQRWHAWYKGDACDSNGVAATTDWNTYVSQSQLEQGCEIQYVGGIHTKGFDNSQWCPPQLVDARLTVDSYLSSDTAFTAPQSGTSQPAACKCLSATSDKDACTAPLGTNCQYARDVDFPNPGDTQWKRLTTEVSGYVQLAAQLTSTFQPPVPGYTPSSDTVDWNPYFPYVDQDTGRLGLGSAPAAVPVVLWSHVQSLNALPDTTCYVDGGTNPLCNIRNNYIGLNVSKQPGKIFRWVPPFAPKWKPVKWIRKLAGQSWGPIRYMAVTQDATSGLAYVVDQSGGVLGDATPHFSTPALQALTAVAAGTQEQLVADDHVTAAYQRGTTPSVLLLDTGTTRIRGAMTATGGAASYVAAPELPAQSTTALRAYSSLDGKLYSIESTNLVTRNVATALAGAPSTSTITISGDVPNNPQALLTTTRGKLVFLDKVIAGRGFWRQRLVALDPVTGVASRLWETQRFPTSDLPIAAFLSLGGFGELIVSFNRPNGTYEIISVRSDDGQPLASLQGAGVLHDAATSDGAGFTVPLNQTPTETQPNVNVAHTAKTGTTIGACGTTWFKSVVGDQSSLPLGNPSQDCL